MIGVDTNILLRFLVDDDPEQSRLAREFLAACTPERPAYICSVTLAETVWVLNRSLGYPGDIVLEMISRLLASQEAIVEHGDSLGQILQELGSGDTADFLIAFSNRQAGCTSTITFDQKAAKTVPGMELIA
jgi:predicted nucleic-acid-binding protein